MGPFLCLVLLFPGTRGVSSVPCQFHVVEEKKTWEEAQQYCRKEFTDLATIDDMAEMKTVNKIVQEKHVNETWIGLMKERDLAVWHWQWSLADKGFYRENESEFRNWAPGQPQDSARDGVVGIKQEGEWHAINFNETRFFICYNGKNPEQPYVLVKELKNWSDAQRYCRENHTDLASIRNQTENDLITEIIRFSRAGDVWIGLFRDAWKWSDGIHSSFRHWAPEEPNYGNNQYNYCTQIMPNGLWNDVACHFTAAFICSEALPTATVDVVSSPPFYSGDAVTLRCEINYKNWHRYVWIKNNSLLFGRSSQAITITLPEEAGQYQCRGEREDCPRTSSVSSYANIWNDDKLVLIREEKTWMEALKYCREKHVDLVSVSSKHIQRWVEGWAKGASSPYVWLGLRHSCHFGFWFWINGDSVCYDNWTLDADRKPGCNVTVGAVTRDGGQWVSRPESEELNFICRN